VTEVGGVDGGLGVVVGDGVVEVVPVDVPVDVAAALDDLELKGTPPEQAAMSAASAINPVILNMRSP
jgi:hypothetical protein